MYVSLGSDCVVKKRLEEYCYGSKQVSHMFDWVLSDLNAVCYMLKNVDKISEEYFEIVTKTVEGYYVVRHKLCYFVSLHDAEVASGEDVAIFDVVQKYSRRIKRLIDCIKKQDSITFIGNFDDYNPIHEGNCNLSVEDLMNFFRTINEINPLNNHSLCILTNKPNGIVSLNEFQRVTIINTREYLDINKETKDWYRFFLDWESLFKRIGVPTFSPTNTRGQDVLIGIP
mgnify:CR=1 FL=1